LHRAVRTEIHAAEDDLLADLPAADRDAFLRTLIALAPHPTAAGS
jgi:hypothetical protein